MKTKNTSLLSPIKRVTKLPLNYPLQILDSLRYHGKDMSIRRLFKTSLNQFATLERFNSQSGQIAVVVFLIMAVMLVVGLSLAGRTSKEIELAGQQEDTTRVFNAAETGIEEALSNETNFSGGSVPAPQTTTDPETNTTTTVTVTPQTTFENDFDPGETATVFTDSTRNGTIDITFGDSTGCSGANKQPALVVTIYSGSGGNVTAEHWGYTASGCNGSTNFQDVSPSGGAYTIQDIPISNGTQMVRIKPLFKSTTIAVSGTNNILAPQSYDIRSQAQDSTSGNTEVRAIQVTRQKPAPPSILDYALYSGDTLTK